MTTKMEELLQREMTRKQFMATLGFGVLSLFGFATIMGLFTPSTPKVSSSSQVGYGGRGYGQ